MRKILMGIFLIANFSIVQAQDYDLGGKIGINYSQTIITDIISDGGVDAGDFEDEPGIGFVFGGFARATFDKFIVQPEVLFSQNKSYIKLNDIEVADVLTSEITKVDIPLLFGYKIFNAIRIEAGPVFSSIKETDDEQLFSLDEITMGYQAGFGFDVNRLTFDIKYEGNLQALESYIETESEVVQFDSRKNTIQFSLGFKLFD